MGVRKYAIYTSPVGELTIVKSDEKIAAIYFGEERFFEEGSSLHYVRDESDPLLKEAVRQLDEYFSKKRRQFSLPLDQSGTPFQLSVWKELSNIPYGETRSYQEIAEAIGNKKAVRAIGQANKANPLPIVIPCHRVIGKNKKLTGYAGTRTDIKEKLLRLEGASFD